MLFVSILSRDAQRLGRKICGGLLRAARSLKQLPCVPTCDCSAFLRRASCDWPAAAISDCGCRMSGTAADLLHFVDSSPTPFHLVSHAEQILTAAGFAKAGHSHWQCDGVALPKLYSSPVFWIRIRMDPELLPGSGSGIKVPDPDPAKSERAY